MRLDKFRIPDNIYKDKRINFEGKMIYAYIYSKGYGRLLIDINIGELQQISRIKNKGLRNQLKTLEKCKYLMYKEYDTGMYTITVN